MKFYHGTNNKDEFLKRGIYKRATKEYPNASDCIYLATDKEEAMQYGKYVFEVEYDPFKNPKKNNYCEGCWQMRVYEPINLTEVRLISHNGKTMFPEDILSHKLSQREGE